MKKLLTMSLMLMLLALGWTTGLQAKTVYIQPGEWTANNTQISLWIWAGDGEGSWFDKSTFTTVEDGVLKAEFADEIDHMIVVQGNNEWGGTQTGNLEIADGKIYKLYDWDGNKSGIYVGHGVVEEDYTEPLLRDYWLEGDAGLISEGWNAADGNKMANFTLTKNNVMLLVGTYGYKVYCGYGDGSWYPSDENKTLEVTENGYYNVTFTFDPATGEPSAVATKTEAIGYVVDFNTAITTTDPDFPVASNWKHIVDSYEDYWGDESYVSYQSMLSDGYGWNGSGCFRVYTNQKSNGTYDLLVTPLVSGKVTLYVKPVGKYYNDSAFLELYSLNSDGTEKGSVLASTNFSSKSNSEEWDWTPLTITLAEEQRIGIRGSQVYMDNFLAENATIVPLTEMRVTSVMSLEGQTGTSGTNPSFNQDENGNVLVQLKVTVNNTGDVDLVTGETENYTLTLAQGSSSSSASTYFEDAAFNVPVNINAGQSATFEVEFNVPATVPSNGYTYFFIRENLSGTTSSSYRYAQIVAYASKFIFDKEGTSYYSSSSATTTPIDFGKVAGEVEPVKYEIYNSGSAPLTINSFTLPEGFSSDAPAGEFTVAGGEKKVITISFTATEPRIYNGNLTIVYTNFGKAQATYTLGISGTIVDASKNLITFSNSDNTNGQFPAGSIHSDNVWISSADDNYYLMSTSTVTKFITPLLTAEAGESFTFDAWYSGYSPDNGNAYVTVFSSTDRVNWTQIAKQTYSSGISSTAKTFNATIEEAGNYYLAFEIGSVTRLDNIYGLTLAEAPAHDWYLTETANIPTTGKQNSEYKASVKVQNISADADAIETATLYVGGEAVATVENIALAANEKTAAVGTGRNDYSNIVSPATVEITYKPHNFGTFPAYIELKSGDAVVKTDEVEVTISEEVFSSEVTPEGDTTNSYAPVYGTWMDASGGSFSDFYYTPEQLVEYGIKKDDVITALTYKNIGTSTKTITSLSGTAWVGMEKASDITIGSPDKDNMTQVTVFDAETVNVASGLEIVIDLSSNPIVYDGTSSIHVFTNFDGHGSYASMSFSADSNYKNAYYAYGTSPSWNTTGTATPIASFSLVVEPTVLAGTVTDANNAAVEGATVTLRNAANDVEYAATTDAEGKYSINVIQNDKAYKAVVNKEGFVSDVTVIDNFDEEVPLTIREFAYGEVWTGEAANADLSTAHFGNMKAGDKVVVSYTEEPTSDRNVKFTKPNGWSTVYAYAWGGDLNMGWPGTQLSEYYMNEYDQQVYNYTVPDDAIGIIFSDNGENQTPDITNFDVTGYYLDNGELKSWTDNNTAIKLCADNGSVIAEGTLADGTAEFELTDALLNSLSAGLIVSVAGTEANITKVELVELEPITITMSALKYATMYYENVNLVVPEGLVAYAAVVGESVDLQEFAAAGDIIPAGTPVVLGGEAGDYDFCVTTEEGTAPTDNDLVGSEEGGKDQEAGFKYYVLNKKNGVAGFYFQKGSAGAYADVRAHSAYLKVEASQAKANGYGFFDGDATGIDSIESNALTENDKVYTLSGVRVNANRVAKGVYIVNGQKMVIK